MNSESVPSSDRRLGVAYYVLIAFSLSIGWGIRGNFGHEYGAMIAGALSAMAMVLMAGRADWDRRIAYFALFGALGWSFGGSMSYMKVIAYTHSGHSPSVLYGYVSPFVIGFLWAAPGGAFTALPAFADRDRLTELFAPMSAVFVTWWVQEVWIVPWLVSKGYELNWFDTDWLGVLLAIVAIALLAAARRKLDRGSILILYMTIGWWVAFLTLVAGLGLRMTPPRGDNWAGCLGLTAGLLAYCLRNGLKPVAKAALVTGFIGGTGFAAASMLQLVEVTSGLSTNWHSILEQTTGLFNGIAIAVALAPAVRSAPRVDDSPAVRRWTEVYSVGFVLLIITYLNLKKNVADWIKAGALPPLMFEVPSSVWFGLIYASLALAVLVPLIRHLKSPLPALAMSWAARGTWLYLIFLWWMVLGNFEKQLSGFRPQRLVTEGVITLNAAVCAMLLLVSLRARVQPQAELPPARSGALRSTILIGVIFSALAIGIDWGLTRLTYGDRPSGHAGLNIRFGPDATIGKPK